MDATPAVGMEKIMKATGINRTGSLLTLQVEQDGQTYLYRVAPDSGELTMVKTYE